MIVKEFARWYTDQGHPLPPDASRLWEVESSTAWHGPPAPEGAERPAAAPPEHRWPWGSYSTPLLDELVLAGELWRLKVDGGSYDPADHGTAPKKIEIETMLQARGVADTNAVMIAAILRSPDVKKGPRPRVGTKKAARTAGKTTKAAKKTKPK